MEDFIRTNYCSMFTSVFLLNLIASRIWPVLIQITAIRINKAIKTENI
ncbi:MAG: hypothetical protein FD133_1947 [Erysipelotrichaceae bacterium]|nr:MAG: hypothetical protein FD133_1947 [Erysipelotrichaceae bacterium]